MRHTQIDFHVSPKRASYLGAILLAMGAVLAGAAVLDDADRTEELESLKSRLERTRASNKRTLTAQAPAPSAELPNLQQFSDIAQRLVLPWGDLLDALESADNKDVALLAIESDAVRGQLRLGGEARSMDALVAYMKSIEDKAGITELRLVSQQLKQNDPQKPIEFTLESQWMQRPQSAVIRGAKS